MDRLRLEDLSIFYWLQDLFSDVAYINIRDGFPAENLVIPTVSVEAKSIVPNGGELGNKKGINIRVWYIDVFAGSKPQRDEMAYKVYNWLDYGIPVYDYNEGFPPSVSPTRLGCLRVKDDQKRLETIRVLPQLVEKLYYRATISFVMVYDKF
jgi:hypothetical protein